MAKRPGVSATFHFIAVKDQHRLLYIISTAYATEKYNFAVFAVPKLLYTRLR